MKFERHYLDCTKNFKKTKRSKLFCAAKAIFHYHDSLEDKNSLDNCIREGNLLAQKVNLGAANNANFKRDYHRVKNNCIAGLLAEHVWLKLLNINKKIVEPTPYSSAKMQIDLAFISNNKSIEVRSSFPRNGLEFAICHPKYQFDVIGPYSNDYKPSEIQKHFYVRTLFPFLSREIENRMKQITFEVYLTGGATWEMMCDDTIAIQKSFIPEDEMSIKRLEGQTDYRVIPFCHALDTVEIFKECSRF